VLADAPVAASAAGRASPRANNSARRDHVTYKFALTAVAVAAAFLLAGCADEAETHRTHSTEATGEATQQTFNDADVAFATDMIPHHRQAIEMAAMAADRSQDPEVKNLAATIQAAQQPEIDTMSAWLRAWGQPIPDGTAGTEGGHGGMHDMPGMMTAEQMNQLHNETGVGFDRIFLTMMIEHHEGAIRMAETEQANGSNPEAVGLAKKIAQDQQAEIKTMQELLGR
jgi:uncharacterized protein (DUF305 family)